MNILDDLKMQYKLGGIANRLIYWNVACFLISFVFPGLFRLFGVEVNILQYVSLSSNPADLLWKPWSFISYSFFHSDFFHILFNMLVLNFASQLFLTFFTQKQFLGLYLLSAVFAGAVFVGSYLMMNISAPMIGASAAIMAVLMAVTVCQPLMPVRLLLIGNVKLWHITAVLLILDLMQLRLENMGGHISHLAGAFFGFVYMKALQNGTDMSVIVTKIIDFFANGFKRSPSTPFKKVHKNYSKPVEKRTASRIVTKDKTQQQIDEILDKISQSGYDSLTKEEKDFLFKSGK
ncbi:Membrane associated serine protease, rhomboid family [Flavobacterium glycines]|uniref:Membrane associated serine protease, rhomboid family n=1 Tax=Flavobacterium glycines TaxID=551990 RepID=A0A1B9DWH1_9FLAO|nr:rhomboid family intramembrane serine protease [Flavobacterium glycines]OCB74043.1 rhomboid family intramembrane serine protease [Flavobacterium glycines]GEL09458.1 rhomboid family intramembrane serine protease [Flavobacterium glycines]SDJ06055.1 Membrane associated serine protease, rhomboid family [Flavobacterium glycines]